MLFALYFITNHIHIWVLCLFWLHPFFLSGVISPLIPSSMLGTYWPGEFLFHYLISFAFSYCSWGSQDKNTEVVCHSLLQWTTFCQTPPPWPAHLVLPPRAWLSFIELDKAVVLVWLDWLVFCEYGFSVSALWCPLATPTVLLGFLVPWIWGISTWLLQQRVAAAPYLGQGVSPHCRPSRPWTWNSSSRPSGARAATAPWTWGSSRPPPLASGGGSSSRLLLCYSSLAPEVRGGGREKVTSSF